MNKKRILYLTELAILVAVILLMSFTPIGYLKVGPVAITFLTIPVILGAIVMGPGAGGILGGIFGLTSFIQCFGMDPFGVVLMGISPGFTVLLCFIPRILLGVLTGWIFKVFKRKSLPAFLVAAISGAVLNTIFFMSGLMLLFGNSEYIRGFVTSMGGGNIWLFLGAFVGINGLVEAAACGLLGTAVSKAVYTLNIKKI